MASQTEITPHGLSDQLSKLAKQGEVQKYKDLLKASEAQSHASMGLHRIYPLFAACYAGQLEMVQCILTDPEIKREPIASLLMQSHLDTALQHACNQGHVAVVKFLLCSPEIEKAGQKYADIHEENEKALVTACEGGHLEMVKFLLESPQLTSHSKLTDTAFEKACKGGHDKLVQYLLKYSDEKLVADVENGKDNHMKQRQVFNEIALRNFCLQGNINMVEYILASEHIKFHANVNDGFGVAIIAACEGGQVEMVKYLLTSPELTALGLHHADIHAQSDQPFRRACANKHSDLIRYLVLDYGIKKTAAIEYTLDAIAKPFFDRRELDAMLPQASVEQPSKKFKL